MDNREIISAAMAQSALELHCSPEDFSRTDNVLTPWTLAPGARAYYEEPIACNMVSYGSNIVASVLPEYRALTAEYLEKFTFYHCFETPNLHWYAQRLAPLGQQVCFMAEYFLPDADVLRPLPCPYEVRLLGPEDFKDLYLPEWSNALCEKRRHLDVLGLGAFDGETLIGLAGCSADCDTMRQIGVDVLPEYRRRGVAAALTSRLAREIMDRGKVPFYCCAWSNMASARNAVKSGFRPAWAELTVKSAEIVEEMNRGG